MKLAETSYDNAETGCCARLDVSAWDNREMTWDDKPFLHDRVRSFMHIPLNYGNVMARDHEAIEAAGAYPQEPLVLTDEASPWRSDVYVAVDRDIPGASIERLSGNFLTKVFEGPYRNAGKWAQEMQAHVQAKGKTPKKIFFYYTTCPKCAKQLGKNYVVLLAQVA